MSRDLNRSPDAVTKPCAYLPNLRGRGLKHTADPVTKPELRNLMEESRSRTSNPATTSLNPRARIPEPTRQIPDPECQITTPDPEPHQHMHVIWFEPSNLDRHPIGGLELPTKLRKCIFCTGFGFTVAAGSLSQIFDYLRLRCFRPQPCDTDAGMVSNLLFKWHLNSVSGCTETSFPDTSTY